MLLYLFRTIHCLKILLYTSSSQSQLNIPKLNL